VDGRVDKRLSVEVYVFFNAGNGSGWASSPVIPVDALIGLFCQFSLR
jgi:hypothetical protein